MRSSSIAWARVVVHTPCSTDSSTPTPTPCSIGSATIASAVARISRNSARLRLHTSTITPTRTRRIATKKRTPANAAEGRWASASLANKRTQTAAAAEINPASCDLQPASAATAVEGGLASTGKAPMRPQKALATPTPMKSRLTSGPSALLGKDRVVAAVCTITTSAMSTASGTTT